MNWQPIETAPKDGRNVLLCNTRLYSPFTGSFWEDAWFDTMGMERDPRHWMPLPEPPKDTTP